MSRKAVTITLILPLLAAITGACGKVGDLEPGVGQSTVPVAYGAKRSQTAEELFAPSVQALPGRTDELMRRSERREVDPFDLPPGATAVPLPDQTADEKQPKVKTAPTPASEPEQK